MRETKQERFRHIAEARVNKIIKMVRLLGNCSGTAYDYTDEQVKEIFNALQTELDRAQERFDRTKSGRKRFSLHEEHNPIYEEYPHISLDLPDGAHLIATVFSGGDYPAINIYLQPENGEEELITIAESNHDRNGAICVGVYQSDQDDTVYYEPYMAERESNENNENRQPGAEFGRVEKPTGAVGLL